MKKTVYIAVLALCAASFCASAQKSGPDFREKLEAAAAVSDSAQHQGAWTLEECISYAENHNISLKQRKLNTLQQEVELNTAQYSRLPNLGAHASQNFSFGRGLTVDNTYANSNTQSSQLNLGAEVPIFQGLQINNNIKIKKILLSAAAADAEKALDDIRVAVAQAYVQVLYNTEILKVAESQVEIDSLQMERLMILLNTGKVGSADVAQQKAALGRSRFSAAQAASNLQISKLELTQLLELPSPEGFEVAAPSYSDVETELLENPESVYAEALAVKPSIKAEELRLMSAEKSIELAKGGYLPTLSASGSIGSGYYKASSSPATSSFSEQMKNNFSQSLGLTLSIPIFNRMATRNNVRSAEISRVNQQLQLDNAKKSLYKDIQQTYYNALASRTKYLSSKEAVASAKESFELTTAKYENGKANITEFNESKNAYLKSEADMVQARYEFMLGKKMLEFYRGAAFGME